VLASRPLGGASVPARKRRPQRTALLVIPAKTGIQTCREIWFLIKKMGGS